jgi:hypothetical protein
MSLFGDSEAMRRNSGDGHSNPDQAVTTTRGFPQRCVARRVIKRLIPRQHESERIGGLDRLCTCSAAEQMEFG